MVSEKKSLSRFSLTRTHQDRISSFLVSQQYRVPIANVNNYWMTRKAQLRMALIKDGIQFSGDSNLDSRQRDGDDLTGPPLSELYLGFLGRLRGLLNGFVEYPLKAGQHLDLILEREKRKRIQALLMSPRQGYFPFKTWGPDPLTKAGLLPLITAWPLRTLHMLRALDVIKHFYPRVSAGKVRVLEIGAGPAILCGLMTHLFRTQNVLVDLPEQTVVGFSLLSEFFPDKKVVLPHEIVEGQPLPQDADVVYLTPQQMTRVGKDTFEVGVNMFSFQEMSDPTVQDYFLLLRRSLKKENRFYCINRVCKPNPFDLTVSEFAKYPWGQEDRFLYDTVIPDGKMDGVRIFGAPVREALVTLKTNNA